MSGSLRFHSILVCLLLWCAATCPAATPRYTVLHQFNRTDGANPWGPVALSGSTLYGATIGGGGQYGGGTLFRVNADGTGFTTLKNFESDGVNPYSGVSLQGSRLYGATSYGGKYGAGILYAISTDGSGYQVLYDLTNTLGTVPWVNSVLASGTNLYGSAESGGAYRYGALLRIGTDGNIYTEFQQFDWNTTGGYPQGLTLSGNTLYGATRWGGNPGGGTLFKVGTDGTGFKVLWNFGSDGANAGSPNGGLVLSGTNIYGTTPTGGSLAFGTVFRVGTDGGGMTILANFPTNEQPAVGVVLGGDTLFGTTCGTQGGGNTNYGNGTLFMLKTNGADYRVLRRFSGPDGANSHAPLLYSAGTLYGTTTYGGATSNGVIFSLTLAPFFETPPQSQVVPSGFDAELAPVVFGLEPLSYQWFLNGTTAIPGATTSRFSFTNTQVADSGTYTLTMSNAFGMVTSPPAIFRVTNMPPVVLAPPSNRNAGVGATVDFSVGVGGSIPRAYQWLFNGTYPLPGATTTSLRLDNVQASQSGAYRLAISNAYGSVTSSPAILQVRAPIVGQPTEAALRAAMAEAGGVVFACDGTITVNNPIVVTNNTVLDATGHQIAISGSSNRLFYVVTNISFGTKALTLSNGFGPMGGGIFNDGGTLTLEDTAFSTNQAINNLMWWPIEILTNSGQGGAIFSRGGAINATNCTFARNIAFINSISTSVGALGGAICSVAGSVNLDRCVFAGNTAQGGPTTGTFPGYSSQAAASGQGGAVYSTGALVVNQCSFSQNLAGGAVPYSAAMPGAAGIGGAICSLGSMSVNSSLLASNSAVGGNGMIGTSGMPGFPVPGGAGSYGGPGVGAALFSAGTASLVNSTFAANRNYGGTGGNGGNGGYAYIHAGQIIYGPGGAPGLGGDAFGVICATNGTLTLTNCTFAYNLSLGGLGGLSGYAGNGTGGGYPGPLGTASAALTVTNAIVFNTIIAANSPSNCVGRVIDAGHNISSDGTCAFTALSSRNNLDPLLGLLGNYGGLTLIFPLLPDSPAVDAGGGTGVPPVDQRGFPRPVGAASDIGAYEYGSPALLMTSLQSNGQVNILVYGVQQRTYRLLASPDLTAWLSIATNQIGLDGTALFHEQMNGNQTRFYRVLLP